MSGLALNEPEAGRDTGPENRRADRGERSKSMITLRAHRFSARIEVRAGVLIGVLLLITFAIATLSMTSGDFPLPVADVVRSLTGRGDTGTDFIVLTLRLPRVLCALLVGAALGMSGAIFQSLTRNPLGSPDFIGLTIGAASGALIVILLMSGDAGQIAIGAMVGCVLTSVAIYLLAYRRGAQGYRLILIGIGVGAMLDAFNSYLITRARLDDAIGAQRWMIGSLNGRGWQDVRPVGIALLVLVPVALMYGRRLTMLSLGDEAASALGVPVERTRFTLFAVSVGLAGVATAAAGPISFVALAAPQLSKRLTGTAGSGLLGAAVMGAFLLTASDWVAQRVLSAEQLPVGIATGAIGGVYLCWLLVHEWRRKA